ncbi:prolyl 4-hydroxylase [Anopheles sinensis]|uniref:Prolyl 4-hydroxylase n=1 Tax=Anopheles sinensis TaxID=74873 RepID=A0A084WC08_ANOSI|nr:prolyl 4-hydroxylase [Anopheles sinensis]
MGGRQGGNKERPVAGGQKGSKRFGVEKSITAVRHGLAVFFHGNTHVKMSQVHMCAT